MKKNILFSLLIMLLSTTISYGQVKIGGDAESNPAANAILDLKDGDGKGLLLPRVENAAFISDAEAGMMVFDTTKDCVMYHDGMKWISLCDVTWAMATQADVDANRAIKDSDGQIYRIQDFGPAGVWMTENLRHIPTSAQATFGGYDSDVKIKYFSYPNAMKSDLEPAAKAAAFDAHPEYGVLYNWCAATQIDGEDYNTEDNVTTVPNTKFSTLRGICPAGWVLPSDYEWSNLEKEIANNPEKYSSNAAGSTIPWNEDWRAATGFRPANSTETHGHAESMKSPIKVTTTEPIGFSKTDGTGFNAQFTGYSDNNGRTGYGTFAGFWSSTSNGAASAWFRTMYVYVANTGVYRSASMPRSFKYTIRCKKQQL